MKKIIILPGPNETVLCGLPVFEVNRAIVFMELGQGEEFKTSSPDAVSTLWYACEERNIPCVIKYEGKVLKDIEAAFAIFNESYVVMDRYLDNLD